MNKLIKNIATSILPQVANIVSNLIIPGLIIVKFGSEINGLVSTTRSVISYISLIGAGIATAVTQALYMPVAKKDSRVVKGMLRAADDMFNRYGLIYILITVLFATIYPHMIKSEIEYSIISGLLIVMSLSGASEFFAIGRCRSLLYAHQRVYVCSIIQASSLLISLILAIILLRTDAGIIVVQFTISFVYVLRGTFLTLYVEKNYPQYNGFKKAEPINTAIEKRNDAMIHQLSGLAVTGSQVTILTLLVDLNAASIYSVYNIVLSGIKMICANLCTAITPFLGKKYALNEKKDLKEKYDLLEVGFFLFVTFFLSVTIIMLLPFVSIYTKNADINYHYPLFAVLFVISTAFYILKLPSTALINVAGHFKETKNRAIIEGSLSIFLSVILTLLFGMNGVLMGTGVALGWRCLDTILYSSKYILKSSFFKSVRRFLISIVNIITFGIWGLSINSTPTGYLQWVIMASFVSTIVILVLMIETVLFERKAIQTLYRYINLSKATK